MVFEVRLTRAAKRDMADARDFIALDSPGHAGRWMAGLFDALDSLTEMPLRHALIAESSELNRALRSLTFQSHRIVYEVDAFSRTVSVVRIYHGVRSPLRQGDLD